MTSLVLITLFAAFLVYCDCLPTKPTQTSVPFTKITATITNGPSRKPCRKRNEILPPLPIYEVKRIYSEHQFFIEIDKNGKVKGTTERNSKYARMKIETAGLKGLFRAKGLETDLYLSMDSQGRLYTTRNKTEENVFIKSLSPNSNFFTTYESYKYCGCYIGFKRNKQPKSRCRTRPNRHNAHFMEIPVKAAS